MHDPFPLPPPAWLSDLTKPFATAVNSKTLHLHIHEILLATFVYLVIGKYVSPFISKRLFPQIYPFFPARTRLNWDIHVVSLVQSVFINTVALYVMWFDDERREMGWEERVWGYTGAGGMIQGFAAGYFVWDLGICISYLHIFGWGLLAHAIAALSVFSFGFRPFVNFYGPTFILYELSSPFLNFHWFFDKLQMTGSKAQWYNGILLLTSFFCCRLLWGTYQSVRVYQDVWAAIHFTAPPLPVAPPPPAEAAETYMAGVWPDRAVLEPLGQSDEIMRYAQTPSGGAIDGRSMMYVPTWLAIVYLGSNIVLNTLNFYWFGKMIETVRSRFREPKDPRKRRWKGPIEDQDRKKRVRGESKGGDKRDLGSQDGGEADDEGEAMKPRHPGGVMVEGLIDSSTLLEGFLNDGGVFKSVNFNGNVKVEADANSNIKAIHSMDKVEHTSTGVEVEETTIRHRKLADE